MTSPVVLPTRTTSPTTNDCSATSKRPLISCVLLQNDDEGGAAIQLPSLRRVVGRRWPLFPVGCGLHAFRGNAAVQEVEDGGGAAVPEADVVFRRADSIYLTHQSQAERQLAAAG